MAFGDEPVPAEASNRDEQNHDDQNDLQNAFEQFHFSLLL
jgi:hypothetical protein